MPDPSLVDDDEPIVIEPQTRMRSRGPARGITPEERAAALAKAKDAANDPMKARQVIADVNRTRMMTAKRLSNITLFPHDEASAADWRARPMASDPPQISILWQLKAELTAARDIEDPAKRVRARTDLLTKMADVIAACTAEAGKASDEWRRILEAQASHEQRQKEHAEKMELERQKLDQKSGNDVPDPGEVRRIAGGQ